MRVLRLLIEGQFWVIVCSWGLVLILWWWYAYFWLKRKEKTIFVRISALRFGSSLIPLCPLLGILGTVWGLMNTLSFVGSSQGGVTNTSGIVTRFATALNTTFWGIFFAVIASVLYQYALNRLEADQP